MGERKKYRIALLPGDGIGVEVVKEAQKVLRAGESIWAVEFEFLEFPVGGASIDLYGVPLTEDNLEGIKSCDAVLLGAVGGPKWDDLPYEVRPEQALLRLRREFETYANLRPAKVFAPLIEASPLKEDRIQGVDILVVRELTGGLYFGEPRGIELREGEEVGVNTLIYRRGEIERIARVAFQCALKRRKKVTSVDKANILESMELWRKVVSEVGDEFPEVELEHMYVDNCSMQLIRWPAQFDVIVTTNTFGDILSDEAAMITGSIGMLPSACIGDGKGIYEPVHGTAPDIAGKDIANPIAGVLSAAMMLEYSLEMAKAARDVERAVERVLVQGYRTPDIWQEGYQKVGCREMGDKIREELLTESP